MGWPFVRRRMAAEVAKADVVIENFSPGVLSRRGLGYEELSRDNPGLIMSRAIQVARAAPSGPVYLSFPKELVMLPFYGVFDNFTYSVDGYTVTLMGQVTRPTLKSDAEAAVKRAKRLPGKHALAVSLFKRSGEITEWTMRFDSDEPGADHRVGPDPSVLVG